MFRQPLLPRVCLIVVLGLGVAAAPARSQDRTPYERLDRLERDLNMLQRQVYRGAQMPAFPGVPGVPGDGPAVANVQIRIDRLEAHMRELHGRVEEVMNHVERVRQQVEQLGSSVDMRFSQMPAGPGPLAAAPPPGRSGPAGPARPMRPAVPAEPPVAADPDLSAPRIGALTAPSGPPRPGAGGLGTLTPPAAASPAAPAEAAGVGPGVPAAAGGVLPSGSATEQYNYAFGLLKQANYPAAEAALKAFIESHPKDQMAGNAQYWLGETYFARGRYMEAATAFAEGYRRWPKSPKAPDGLLKLGMSLARANETQKACVALGQLDHAFPQAAASVKERAAAERKRLGC